ncbi:unnamed protein product [Auanema sp. JU1783]|nr:unnamed protein product [Auanema sp. JU1783]
MRIMARNRFSTFVETLACDRWASQFESLIGARNVVTKSSQKQQFMKDEGHFRGKMPEVVLLPESVEQVSDIMKICNSFKIPVIPFGTGTGLEGGVVHVKKGVSIVLSNLGGGITKVSPEDGIASVRPSVTRTGLNSMVRQHGLFFSVDPGADASVCGMVATGASGTNAIRYGTMKENVVNLEIVLADGSVINTRGKNNCPPKTSAGYNLTELFVGSEGTLGVIIEATIRLHSLPSCRTVAVTAFDTTHSAVQATMEVIQSGIPVARIEFLDDIQVAACNKYSSLTMPVAPTLFLEFHGFTDASVQSQLEYTKSICSSYNALSFVESENNSDIDKLWKARHNAYYAALSLREGSRGFTTDVCVPISKLADVITLTKKDLIDSNLVGTIVGHVGDGNFHVILPVVDMEKELPKVKQFSDRLVKRALTHNGTCTGEHGVGMGKLSYLEDEVGKECLNVMRMIKQSLDPNNIMNPGKVLK